MSQDVFAIVPIDVIQDSRLTKRQIKVLIALLSFRGKNTNTVWPSREKLSERCGIRPTTISLTTSELVDLGWLTKDGKGGFSKSTRYQITVPNLSTVPNVSTVPKTSTPTVPNLSTGMGVPNLSTGKELTKNITNRTKRGNKRFTPPTIDEVLAYCFERNNLIDAEAFVNHYQANGWMRGKNKIKDWKACMRTWETSQKQRHKSSHVHAATLAARGIDIDTGQSFGTGLEQIAGLLN